MMETSHADGASAQDCWQNKGCERESERARGKGQKGTPTAVVTKALWKVTGLPKTLSQGFNTMFIFMFMNVCVDVYAFAFAFAFEFPFLLFMFTVVA